MLVYRSCRCCRHICSKLLHTLFHMLGIPCIGLGFLAIWNYHSLRKDRSGNPAPLPHFYSLHSWLGLITMGLALLQVRSAPAAGIVFSWLFISVPVWSLQLPSPSLLQVFLQMEVCHGPHPLHGGHNHLHTGHHHSYSWDH